jgi:hypothetical protein
VNPPSSQFHSFWKNYQLFWINQSFSASAITSCLLYCPDSQYQVLMVCNPVFSKLFINTISGLPNQFTEL